VTGGCCKGGNTPPPTPEDDAARTDGLVGDRALEAQVSLTLADDGGRCRALSACQVCHACVGASSMIPPLEGGARGMGMLPAGEGVDACAYDRI
jgi:hypothetical protein